MNGAAVGIATLPSMAMRFSEYLAGMTDAARQTLANDLTLGAGRLAFALRLHGRTPATLTMLTAIAGAYAMIRQAALALGTTIADDAPPNGATTVDALPERWVAAVRLENMQAIGGRLQIAAEMMCDALTAVTTDATVACVSELLQSALAVLGDVRDDALSVGPECS